MSTRLFPADVMFEQRLLACGGFYKGALDGRYGPVMEAAEDAAAGEFELIRARLGSFDQRSERAIATLLPAGQRMARSILATGAHLENGLRVSILSGTRTYAEQNALYAQGRTAKGAKVTNARGGQSWHNFGIAVDVGIFRGADYLTGAKRGDDDAYRALAAAVKRGTDGVEWGGDWKSFKDLPHYQLGLGMSLASARSLFEAGTLKGA